MLLEYLLPNRFAYFPMELQCYLWISLLLFLCYIPLCEYSNFRCFNFIYVKSLKVMSGHPLCYRKSMEELFKIVYSYLYPYWRWCSFKVVPLVLANNDKYRRRGQWGDLVGKGTHCQAWGQELSFLTYKVEREKGSTHLSCGKCTSTHTHTNIVKIKINRRKIFLYYVNGKAF